MRCQSLPLTAKATRHVAMETAAALDGFGGFGGPAEPMDGDETFKQVDEVAQRLGMEVRFRGGARRTGMCAWMRAVPHGMHG